MTCQQCGRTKSVRPCEVRPYCSTDCYHETRAGVSTTPKITRECLVCGKEITNYASQIGMFCSKEHADEAKVQDPVERWRKYNAPIDDSPDSCHHWTQSLNRHGYGKFWLNGHTINASNASWVLFAGPVPKGMHVQHLCDVKYPAGDTTYRRCVRLDHLTIGPPRKNAEHMSESGRAATGDRHSSRTKPERVARGDRHGSVRYPESTKRGSMHGMAKLTEDDVRAIRSRRDSGETIKVLAADFRVSASQACAIAKRRSWQWLD